MFFFIARYFGFLKHLPLVPHVYESMLKIYTLLRNPWMFDCIDAISTEALTWPGVSDTMHKYGGLQFDFAGRELGHIHGNGILDIRLSRKIKQQLMAEGRINHHHIFVNTGWISFYIRNVDDEDYALKLLRMSYEFKCTRPGTNK